MKKTTTIRQKTNAASCSTFFQPTVQGKLAINRPGDKCEQEADTIADKVMQMPDNSTLQSKFFNTSIRVLSRKCAHCEKEEPSCSGPPLAREILFMILYLINTARKEEYREKKRHNIVLTTKSGSIRKQRHSMHSTTIN